jgi:hypothetical protein
MLNEDWALITRSKLPGIIEPPKKLGDHWAAGLSMIRLVKGANAWDGTVNMAKD